MATPPKLPLHPTLWAGGCRYPITATALQADVDPHIRQKQADVGHPAACHRAIRLWKAESCA